MHIHKKKIPDDLVSKLKSFQYLKISFSINLENELAYGYNFNIIETNNQSRKNIPAMVFCYFKHL